MKKIIIGIHGLENKPSKRLLNEWWKQSMVEGLVAIGKYRELPDFELVYWADAIYDKPLNPDITDEKDPYFLDEFYTPATTSSQITAHNFRLKAVDFVVRQLKRAFLNKDLSLKNSAIAENIVQRYFHELDIYYKEHCNDENCVQCKSKREMVNRVVSVLKKYENHEILLIGHSMGSILGFDAICFGIPDIKINTFITIGSPLGLPLVNAPRQCSLPLHTSVKRKFLSVTGRSPVAARMTRFSAPLPRDEITLPELLRDKGGYFTGVCGRSFHLDGSTKIGQAVVKVFQEHQLKTFSKRVDFLDVSNDSEVTSHVAAFLDKKPGEKPFFLWANFNDPHHVWDAPAEYRPDPASLKLPPHLPDLPGVREQFADYCAEVNRLDRTVAGVLAELKKRDLMDNTIIIFCGDNGMAMPHGKGSLYDPGSNVPCIVRWPGTVKPGGDTRALISGEDLAPTLLAAAGLEPGSKMSGVSFLPLLKGEPHVPRKHIFIERGPHGSAPVQADMSTNGYDLSRAVRSNRYKFIYNCTPWIPYAPVDSPAEQAWKQIREANVAGKLTPGQSATYFTTPRPVYELYDLDADPGELNNLSGKPEFADTERELRAALAEKMILDWDYLPIPDLMETEMGETGQKKGKRKK
jgi:N-sulfoglucosamine sulfohydrolase